MSKHLMIALSTMFIVSAMYSCTKPVQADEIWGEVHLASRHSQPTYNHATTYRGYGGSYKTTEQREFNERNLGLGAMYGINPHVEIGAGFYKNSYNRTSVYVGGDLHTDSRRAVRLGVRTGAITGYEESDWMILPNVTVGSDHVRLMVGVIPGKISVLTATVGMLF